MHMNSEFALDLSVARRKSGLTQADCAHLLEVHPSKVSLLESGKTLPSVREICLLSLVYGRSFESLFGGIFDDAQHQMVERLRTMPRAPKRWLGNLNRANTLRVLAKRLEAHAKAYGDTA